MEILTREGRNSWFPSGVYFSRVNRVFYFFFFFPAFLLRMSMSFLFAPCFNHFQSDRGNGKCYNQPTVGMRGDEERNPSSWEEAAGRTARNTSLPSNDDMPPGVGHGGTTHPEWKDERAMGSHHPRETSGGHTEAGVAAQDWLQNTGVKDSPKHLWH